MNFSDWYSLNRTEILKDLDLLIRIKSVMGNPEDGAPFGRGPADALNKTLNLFRRNGFTTVSVKNYCGFADWGTDGIILGIPLHVDVVPENGEWKTKPWELTVNNNKLFGRGVQDNKGAVIQILSAAKYLMESGYKPAGRIRVIFGTNEENGMKGIKHCPDNTSGKDKIPFCFVPDSEFPVINAEKGIINFRIYSETEIKYPIIRMYAGDSKNSVPPAAFAIINGNYNFRQKENIKISEEKGGLWKVEAFGRASHSADPEQGINAVTLLFKYLKNYFTNQFIDFYLEFLAEDNYGIKTGIDFSDKYSGKLTVTPGYLRDFSINLDIRYPVTMDTAGIREKLKKHISEYSNLKIEEGGTLAPLFIPEDDYYIKKLSRSFASVTGWEGKTTIYSGGGTYARAFEKAAAFGPLFPGKEGSAHKPDENMSEDDFKKGMEVYAETIKSLCS